MDKAIGYVRVSTDDQQLGIEAQKTAIIDYCNKNNLELIKIFEEHISGGAKLENRIELMNAIGSLSNEIKHLLVARRDRIARDIYVSVMVDRLVEHKKSKIISVDGSGNGDGPEAALMRHILSAFSQFERALIKLRIQAVMNVKRNKGECLGTVPFGYKKIGKLLIEDEEEQNTISRIIDLGSSGLSLRKVCKILTDEGREPRSKNWYPTSIKNIMDRIWKEQIQKEKIE